MHSVDHVLSTLDGSLDPTLAGTLAALALTAAAFVYGRQVDEHSEQYKTAGKRFIRAVAFLIGALVVDLGLFPMLGGFVTATTELDFERNFTTTLFDTSSQYVLFLAGVLWLYLGSASLARSFGIRIYYPWEILTPSESPGHTGGPATGVFEELSARRSSILGDIRRGGVRESAEHIQKSVMGGSRGTFKKELKWLRKQGYVEEERADGQTVYYLSQGSENRLSPLAPHEATVPPLPGA